MDFESLQMHFEPLELNSEPFWRDPQARQRGVEREGQPPERLLRHSQSPGEPSERAESDSSRPLHLADPILAQILAQRLDRQPCNVAADGERGGGGGGGTTSRPLRAKVSAYGVG